MSYDIRLTDPVTGEDAEADAPHQMRGGTYQIGDCRRLWLNVTYNYWNHFRSTLGGNGIRTIYGMTGAQSIPVLAAAIALLKDDVSADYWEPTEGNAKRALCQLKAMAELRPDGVWEGD